MAVQQFCLRWNNHQPNFISVFTTLLNNETLVDVTLAAEGQQLQAHKVVLSACSTYFQNLFTANPCTHPIVILKDIKYSDLKIMVDFMYYGEVNVSQDQLPAILKTAEALKVKGLAEMPEQLSLSKSHSQSSDKCDSPGPTSPSVLRRKRFRKSSTGSGSEQTSEETAASGSGSGTTEMVSPLPVKVEPEDSSSLKQELSTESEPRESSVSFEEEIPITRNPSEETSESNIRWPSVEEKPGTSQSNQQALESSSTGSSMGSKRGRLLMRQNRIKKESELGVDLAPSPDPPEPGGSHQLLLGPSRGVVERQCSEPTPSYLSVPVTSHLVKQNSSPHLSYTSSTQSSAPVNMSSATPAITSTSSQVPSVHIQAPSPTESSSTPTITKSKSEEFRRAFSTVECTVTEACEGSRFCHCPVLRPGPALGCNFCWNTIDTHGRILRRKTKYHCPECQINLCIVPCFQEFHEKPGVCRREPPPSQSTSGSSPPSGSSGTGSQQQEWSSIVKTSSSSL